MYSTKIIKVIKKINFIMNKHNWRFFSFLTLSFLSLIIPLLILKDKSEGFKLGIELLTGLSAILTLIIAINLFDRFGIRNKLIDYQTNSVIKLIEILRKTHCRLKGHKLMYEIWFSRDQESIKKFLKDNKEDGKLVVFHHGQNIMIPKSIEESLNDLWLPESIRKRLDFLDFRVVSIVFEEKVDSEKFIVAEFENDNQDAFLAKENMTAIEFINNIEILITEVTSWIEEYASIKINLNLRPY